MLSPAIEDIMGDKARNAMNEIADIMGVVLREALKAPNALSLSPLPRK